jgi:hypothetical protein
MIKWFSRYYSLLICEGILLWGGIRYYEQENTPALGLTIVLMCHILYTMRMNSRLTELMSEYLLNDAEVEEHYVKVLSKLKKRKDLRPWELNFVASLDPDKFRYWTLKQRRKLKEIGNTWI